MKNGAEFHWSKVIFMVVFAWSSNYQITKKPLNTAEGFFNALYTSLTREWDVHRHSNYFVWKPNNRTLTFFQPLNNIQTVNTATRAGCGRNFTFVQEVLEFVGRNFIQKWTSLTIPSPPLFPNQYLNLLFKKKKLKCLLTPGRDFISNKSPFQKCFD